MMKNLYLLAFALLLPLQAMAVETDSVYTWGKWANGIRPAAGPVARVTPPPVQTINVNLRANETSAFSRQIVATAPTPVTPIIIPPPVPVIVEPPVITPTPVAPPGDPRQRRR